MIRVCVAGVTGWTGTAVAAVQEAGARVRPAVSGAGAHPVGGRAGHHPATAPTGVPLADLETDLETDFEADLAVVADGAGSRLPWSTDSRPFGSRKWRREVQRILSCTPARP